ncbi:MAG: chloride channel protein, partial [Candidatus Krumholzibacteriia bacterium]
MAGVMLTVGTGGSAGPEGPVAFSGAAIGSNLGTFLGLTERRRITLLGCGVAGATAAIFNAPVTRLMYALRPSIPLADVRYPTFSRFYTGAKHGTRRNDCLSDLASDRLPGACNAAAR